MSEPVMVLKMEKRRRSVKEILHDLEEASGDINSAAGQLDDAATTFENALGELEKMAAPVDLLAGLVVAVRDHVDELPFHHPLTQALEAAERGLGVRG